jgi:hypothetical protein
MWPTRRYLTRRGFIRGATGAGAGLLLGSQVKVAHAAEATHPDCPPVPRPIPHITAPPGAHFFFPGPVDADPVASPNIGHDPSLITDFDGVIAQADLDFSGTGTNLQTGESAAYDFHCDMRFMNGVFVGLDNQRHHGTLGFI